MRVLSRAEVLDKIRSNGLSPDSMTWRKLDSSPIKSLHGLNSGSDGEGAVIYPVEDLSRLLYEEVRQQPSVTIHWNHKIVSVGQNESIAFVEAENGNRLEADFVVGCDGASSAVRKALFGQTFPGKTWDNVIVGTNVYVPALNSQKRYANLSCS